MLAHNQASITVVTPAYNEANNVADYLKSLSRQTVLPKEVILVNHNSQDNTLKLMHAYKKCLTNQGVKVRILTEKKPGIAQARNRGWFSASQPIIASLDMDCRPENDWIKSIRDFFSYHQDVAAVTGKVVMDHQAPAIIKLVTRLNWYKLMFHVSQAVYGFPHFSTANGAVKKEAFLAVGGFSDTIRSINDLDDIDLARKLSTRYRVSYNPHMVVKTSFRRYRKVKNAVKTVIHRHNKYKELGKRFKQVKDNP